MNATAVLLHLDEKDGKPQITHCGVGHEPQECPAQNQGGRTRRNFAGSPCQVGPCPWAGCLGFEEQPDAGHGVKLTVAQWFSQT